MKPYPALRVNPWREISILMIILMEVCWVTPWFRSLTAATSTISSLKVFIILTGLVLFAHILVRTMDFLRLQKSVQQGIMLIFIIIGIFAGIKTMLYAHESMSIFELFNQPLRNLADLKSLIPPEFIVTVAVVIAFWRGLSIAQGYIGPASVMDHFWFGIIMYVAFVFLNTLTTGETPGDFIYIFLFTSLLAMCTARMNVIKILRGGKENQFNRFWFMGIILAASFAVGLAATLGDVVGEQSVRAVTILFGFLVVILGLVWFILGPLITFLITILSELFSNLLNNKPLGEGLQNFSQLMQEINQRISNILGRSAISIFFERWGSAIKIIILIIFVILVISGVLYWMVIKLWRDRTQASAEQKTNLSPGNIVKLLMDLLRERFADAKNFLAQVTDFNRRQRMRAAARIRQVYAELMDLCDSLGHPRPEADTPLEFLPQLKLLFPELRLEASLITDAYNNVRYGQLPETRREVEEIEAAWKKLRIAGHELAAAQKHEKKK